MYDHYSYPSYAYHQTHPHQLAATARLLGLRPAPVEHCRVLEIGCGSGGNLLPMAVHHPQSTFLGIDPAQPAIAEGHRHLHALGLENLRLQATGVEALDLRHEAAWDYIICHGVWSWVPEAVQTAILTVCTQALAPHGVAVISYNVYPGWHEAGALRALLLRQRDPAASPTEQVRAAREQLDHLAELTRHSSDTRHLFLNAERERWKALDDAYVYYEYLAGDNRPEWFDRFIGRARRHGLRYLGNGDRTTLWPSSQDASVAAAMRACSSLVMAQQTQDLLTNRRFRTTLLCHAEAPVDLNLTPDRLHNLWFRALFDGDPLAAGAADSETVRIHMGEQYSADVRGVGLLQVLSALARAAPGALGWEQLRTIAAHRAPDLEADLLHLALGGFIDLHAYPAPVAHGWSDRPMASPLARRLALAQQPIIADLWHRAQPLSPPQRDLLAMLDGSRSVAELTASCDDEHNLGDALSTLRRRAFLMGC